MRAAISIGRRKRQAERGASRRRAFGPEPAAMRFDDRPADRHAQPGTGPGSGEQWLEQVDELIVRQSRPAVLDAHNDLVAASRRADRDAADIAAGERIAGIREHDRKDLLEQEPVDTDAVRVGRYR